MKIIKRNGNEVEYDGGKIINAVGKANMSVGDKERMSDLQIMVIEENVRKKLEEKHHVLGIEEIQDLVIHEIMRQQAFRVAQLYTEYRYKQMLLRQKNSTDDAILSLIEYENEEIKQENSNKNPMILSTQRDYIAGEVSKDLTWRMLLPRDIVEAHEKGLIHFHDADYFIHHEHNCCLINLDDMLENGTVITEVKIDPPNSITTACTVTSQIIAQVASFQFGGQTFALSHLVPFVDKTRQKHRKRLRDRFERTKISYTEEQLDAVVEEMVKDDIASGIQTIQYQLLTLMTTNGQTPFVSMYINLGDVPEGRQRDDLILMITEVFRQRIQGVKNEKGVYVTAAFPKILYVLDEDNILPDSPYIGITTLAAKCTAARMVPDYISAKVMREYTRGDVYGCMGCVDKDEVIVYRFMGQTYVESFRRAWERLSDYFDVKLQPNGYDLYMDTPGMWIYDQEKGFVRNQRIIKNHANGWLRIVFKNGRMLTCTPDHPFETQNRGVVCARDLKGDDLILADKTSRFMIHLGTHVNPDRAWLYGVLLCDSSYSNALTLSIAASGEDEIKDAFVRIMKKEYGLEVSETEQHRGKKGNYKDLRAVADDDRLSGLRLKLATMFGGYAKKDRHIPNEVFSWDEQGCLAFLAGMIDADGYINDANTINHIQIGSTNKELAIQQALLAQACGMRASIYPNHYRANCKDCIRYRVEFEPSEELLSFMVCQKKKDFVNDRQRKNRSISLTDDLYVSSVEQFEATSYSYDVTTESGHFTVSGIYSHNCRSFLTPDRYSETVGNISNAGNFDKQKHHYWGRFNQGVVTVNLVDVACSSGKDMEKFWEIFDERLELCHRALRKRHERLLGTPADMAPILWRHGALARLGKGETIDRLLYNGYSTISLGYAGLYEMCYYMTGKSHTEPEGKEFALEVMRHMNDRTAMWKEDENIDYSLYGTPLESTTYRFAKCLQKRFGTIENVTDHNYITNSYHKPKMWLNGQIRPKRKFSEPVIAGCA